MSTVLHTPYPSTSRPRFTMTRKLLKHLCQRYFSLRHLLLIPAAEQAYRQVSRRLHS
ncbi:hypothetical protein BCR39DRAFT_529474 [Naematelia encephala]|uniref:Uncharacterized protein n=1 Tax=Naematelia encephala TaxID=71784 RepID=A0A1Y2B6A3_9TREE|nr:hypothetical protein BCR39DRAFT_529474 [Naematelia encephala]